MNIKFFKQQTSIRHVLQLYCVLPEVEVVVKGGSFDLAEVRTEGEVKTLQPLQLPEHTARLA